MDGGVVRELNMRPCMRPKRKDMYYMRVRKWVYGDEVC